MDSFYIETDFWSRHLDLCKEKSNNRRCNCRISSPPQSQSDLSNDVRVSAETLGIRFYASGLGPTIGENFQGRSWLQDSLQSVGHQFKHYDQFLLIPPVVASLSLVAINRLWPVFNGPLLFIPVICRFSVGTLLFVPIDCGFYNRPLLSIHFAFISLHRDRPSLSLAIDCSCTFYSLLLLIHSVG